MAVMTNANRKVRVSLDLPAAFNTRLEALEKLTQADSKAGVIRQALQVYEYIARKTVEGYSFRAVTPDGKEENLVFFSPYITESVEDAELVCR
jgi:hypothetical protein